MIATLHAFLLGITLAAALFFAVCAFGKLSIKAELCYQLHRLLTLPFFQSGVPPIPPTHPDQTSAYWRLCGWLSKQWIPEYFRWCQSRNQGRGW